MNLHCFIQEAVVRVREYIVLPLLILCLISAVPAVANDGDVNDWQAKMSLGYRVVDEVDNAERAAEYSFIGSSPTFSVDFAGGGVQHVKVEADYLNENDYRAELHLDRAGLMRLNLRSERMYHNLNHIPYDPQFRPAGTLPDGTTVRVDFDDDNPGDSYGLRIDTNEVKMRGKLENYPAHVNLSYWRFEKKGEKQQRFFEESCAAACHMKSQTRDVDQVTDEFTAGVDAHIGPVDVIFEQLYREFRDRESIPVDDFEAHMLRPVGTYQHDSDPESKLTESTLKLHTSLSGGVNAAASFTLGERENRSDLADVTNDESETDYYKAAGDLTWIPSPRWTLNFRYRLLDLDNSNSSLVYTEGIQPVRNPVEVRDNVDLRRASYEAQAAYRPTRNVTLKGQFHREEIHRGNTGIPAPHSGFAVPVSINPVWELPEDENINRYRMSFYARPLGSSKLKFNGWYQYRTSDDPAYGNSFEDSHEAFLGTTYSPSARWGGTASIRGLSDTNNDHQITDAEGGSLFIYDLDRDLEQQNLSIGMWARPTESISCNLSYGYLRSRLLQDLLYGNDSVDDHVFVDENTEFSQRVQTVSANLTLRVTDDVNCRLEGYHIRSMAEFSPGFAYSAAVFDFPADSSSLKELSRVDLRQNGIKLGADWRFDEAWSCSAVYTYDDYEDKDSSVFDGSLQTYMVSLARSW